MSADTILALGLNHTIAPVAIREKLAFSSDCSRPLLSLRALPGCDECLLLSTCNRVEVYFVSKCGEAAADAARRLLFAGTDLSDEEARRYTYFHQGGEAVRHLFRVAASLDSMVVGEPQILGQLKEAFRLAGEHKAAGFLLDRLFTKAFFVAKRVRTETNIGGSAVSISYAAVQLAKKILGDLAGRKVLLVGAGEMAELAAEHLVGQGIGEVVVANRTYERAVTLATRFHGRAVPLDDLHAQMEGVDILISSTGAPGFILTRDELKPVMRQRMHRPLFLIDIAVPRDLDPAINDLDNVYLYDIDDLMSVVETGKADRDQAAAAAELIVAHEATKFGEWLNGLAVVPTIAALKKKSAALCQAELAKTMAHLGTLSDQQKKAVEVLAQSIANKMLHHPMLFLKQDTGGMDTQSKLSFIRACYDLDETGGDELERP